MCVRTVTVVSVYDNVWIPTKSTTHCAQTVVCNVWNSLYVYIHNRKSIICVSCNGYVCVHGVLLSFICVTRPFIFHTLQPTMYEQTVVCNVWNFLSELRYNRTFCAFTFHTLQATVCAQTVVWNVWNINAQIMFDYNYVHTRNFIRDEVQSACRL